MTRSWGAYIEQFHSESPGVTESVLGRAVDADGATPYCWAAAGADAGQGPVLDVGCGNGPAHSAFAGWVGVDASAAEVRAARAGGRSPVVAARAEALPIRDRSVGAALLVMSLMVVDDPAAVLAELSRVLQPPRAVCLVVPTDRPTTAGDRVRYGALLAALGRTRMPFPRPDVVRNPRAVLASAGFTVTDDERRRFAFTIASRADADQFVDSLYLPGVSGRRARWARVVAHAWGKCEIGIPLRRLRAEGDD